MSDTLTVADLARRAQIELKFQSGMEEFDMKFIESCNQNQNQLLTLWMQQSPIKPTLTLGLYKIDISSDQSCKNLDQITVILDLEATYTVHHLSTGQNKRVTVSNDDLT